MKILITGTHFTPAQAVIEELQNVKDIEIVYVGRKTTMEGDRSPSVESQIIPKLGIKFIPLISGRLKRDLSIWTLVSWLKIPIGFLQGFWIVLVEQPDVVVSFGGYLAVPIVFAAWVLNIPVLIHDQTLVFGLASRVSSLFATKVAVTFDTNYPVSKSKLIVTGNPIRKDFFEHQKNIKHSKLPTILITGGNQGSHFLNESISEILDEMTEKFLVIHQTGDSKYHDFDKLYDQKRGLKHPENYKLEKFIPSKEMVENMRVVDLVICRAGANTLLELSYLGTPTLIIPVPYVQKDEQTVNAKYFSKAGLGEYLLQNGLSSQELLKNIKKMVDRKEYKNRAKNAKKLVIENAAQKLTQEILLLAQHA